ncbi:hypothetical protein DPMN_066824 [Dreissena polymorpha]|uniref:Myosin heavy chain n=1 Tax=Dreissena polymorpha TaxID=45954 RepID=A0A9D4BVC2_DREPO|nr:hypothetical protein DPMN_066824 [Dreissena polymorpha]
MQRLTSRDSCHAPTQMQTPGASSTRAKAWLALRNWKKPDANFLPSSRKPSPLSTRLTTRSAVEKNRSRIQMELEKAVVNSDRAGAAVTALEKRNHSFDKVIADWQLKVRSLQSELENAQKESRSYSAELFRVKTQYEEVIVTVDSLRRENSNLSR